MPFRSPLAAAAVLAAPALLLPDPGPVPAWSCAIISSVLLLAGARAAARGGPEAAALRAGLLLVPLAFLPLALFVRHAASVRPPGHVAALLAQRGGGLEDAVDLGGRLAGEPRRMLPPARGCSLDLEVERLTLEGWPGPARGAARISIPPAPAGVDDPCALPPRSRVRLAARLFLPEPFGDPGAPDPGRLLDAKGISAVGRAPGARLVGVVERAPLPWRLLSRGRRWWIARLESAFDEASEPGAAGTARAITVGDRSRLDPELQQSMRRAGTVHLLAISGFHVAVVGGMAAGLAWGAGAGWRMRRLVPALLLALFLLVCGPIPSASRAVGLALLVAGAGVAGRGACPATGLAAILLSLLAWRPGAAADPALQLSFVAAAALLLWAPSLARRIPGPRWAASLLAVNAVAVAMTTPLVALHFNRVTPGALLANLAASPQVAAGLVASLLVPPASTLPGLLSGLGVDLSPDLAPAVLLARLAALLFRGAAGASALAAGLPCASWMVTTPPGPLVAGTLMCAVLATARGLHRTPRWIMLLLAAAAVLWIALPVERPGPLTEVGLRVTFLDVGQGSSLLVETPEGARILVDAGGFPRTAFDVGERVVARSLLSLGIRSLDAVVVSHEDVDHAGGIGAVLELFGGSEIWLPAGWAANPRLEALAELATERGRVVRVLEGGMVFTFSGAGVKVLGPQGRDGGGSDNERSLILRLEGRRASVLVPGDIGAATEEGLLGRLRPVDLLQVPHHGSRSSSSPGFLSALQPEVAVISCGRRNRYGHPATEVLRRLEVSGTAVFRTDRDGALRVELPGAGERIRVERWSGGGWELRREVPVSRGSGPGRGRSRPGEAALPEPPPGAAGAAGGWPRPPGGDGAG